MRDVPLDIDPRIDLTKPIYEQVLALEKADREAAGAAISRVRPGRRAVAIRGHTSRASEPRYSKQGGSGSNAFNSELVMPGAGRASTDFEQAAKSWMAGPSPAMTGGAGFKLTHYQQGKVLAVPISIP